MKMKLKKLVRSAKCLVLSAALCAVGLSAWAEPQKIDGSDVTWELTENNTVLTIAGTGAMPDFESQGAPWYDQRTSIQTLEIKSGVTRIGAYAFNDCTGMRSVTIPASVTSIGGDVFAYGRCIAELRIDSIESWCKISFDNANSTPFQDSAASTKKLYVGGTPTTDLVIPDGIEILNHHVFGFWDMLTSVTIPSSVTSIGVSAFTFCSGLESVTIPSSVTNIGMSAFNKCSVLESVVIPSSVTSIGDSAFNSCKGLKSVTISPGVTSLDDYAFSYCSGLESVVIPSSVTNIGKYAFQNCSRLMSVMIPSSVERIGDSAFNSCSNTMSVIEMRKDPPKAGSNVFGTVAQFRKGGTIYVPIESLSKYKQTSPWSNYRNQTMPAYLVSGVAEHGVVEMSKNCFPSNEYTTASETVTVTVTPDEGYLFKSLVWNDGTDHDITETKSFTMPLACVTVTAVFEAEPSDEEVVATAEATFVLGPALAVANVTTATHWPWDGKIDVTCDLTGAGKVQLSAALTTNGVTVCTAKAENITGETVIDLDQVGGVTNGVKFTWDAKADCPAGFNSKDTKVKVSLIAVKAAKPVAPEGFVDLGVKDADGKPLFWAEKNLGASNPEDYGDYFAWGETAPYYTTTGGWPATPTWKSGKESGYAWQSYCASSSFSEWSTPPYDATSKILKPEFDAATVANSSWRTPTSEEFEALAANCVWIWTAGYNSTSKSGYIVYKAKSEEDKGKANMNGTWKKWNGSSYSNDSATTESYSISDTHIFFPAAGYSQSASLSSGGSNGSYWSSSLSGSPENALYLYCKSSIVMPQYNTKRCSGISVRPVTN